jgi:Neuraminidase (sialidase)
MTWVLATLAGAEAKETLPLQLVLAPTPGNPRNSEGDFIQLKDGRILFIYSHFTGGSKDGDQAFLASRVSLDGGQTWSQQDQKVVDPSEHQTKNVMSVSLLRLSDDRIALFYLVKQSPTDSRLVMRTSADQGATWGEPTVCTTGPGYFLVANGRVVRLKSGRIVLPASRHDLPEDPKGSHRGISVCFYSDDQGITWHASDTPLAAPAGSHSGFQYPAIAELKDGRLMMLMSMHLRPLYRAFSTDGGKTWSPAEPTDLPTPISPASIKQIPSSGDLLLVWNDHSHIDSALKNSRTPLTAAISTDDGKTWSPRQSLFSNPAGSYSFTAIAFVENRVLLGLCANDGQKKSGNMSTLVITSFDLQSLLSGAPSPSH